jgi:hypothetical protein
MRSLLKVLVCSWKGHTPLTMIQEISGVEMSPVHEPHVSFRMEATKLICTCQRCHTVLWKKGY